MKRSKPKKRGRKFNVRVKLDGLLRSQIFERDGHRCLRCRTTRSLNMAHIFPKGRYAAMRWEPDNLLTLCSACHLFWAHMEPVPFSDWVRKNWPERYERLWQLANSGQKVNPKQLYEELKWGAETNSD